MPGTREDRRLPLWCPTPPSYADALAASRPVYDRPELRGRVGLVIRRAAAHPVWTTRTLAAVRDVRATCGLLLWQETATWFGFDAVHVAGRGPLSLRPLTRGDRASAPVAGRDAVTGVVIAQNEAPLMQRVLDSLQPYVATTVVVDGGSTDDTAAIARARGAHVVERAFDDDFAAQRNAALERVRTPWVLTLDCDEQLPAQLGDELMRCLGAPVDAVYVSRLDLVGDDPQPSLFPDMLPRLFRSHLRYTGRVHERIDPRRAIRLPANGPFIHHHKSPLRHYSNSLHYSEIDPGQSTPELVAWMQQEVDRLRGAGPGDGDLPRAAQ